jgi:hypothetical protein
MNQDALPTKIDEKLETTNTLNAPEKLSSQLIDRSSNRQPHTKQQRQRHQRLRRHLGPGKCQHSHLVAW